MMENNKKHTRTESCSHAQRLEGLKGLAQRESAVWGVQPSVAPWTARNQTAEEYIEGVADVAHQARSALLGGKESFDHLAVLGSLTKALEVTAYLLREQEMAKLKAMTHRVIEETREHALLSATEQGDHPLDDSGARTHTLLGDDDG